MGLTGEPESPISVLTHDSAATGSFSSRPTYIFYSFRTRAGRQENMSGAERERVRGGGEAQGGRESEEAWTPSHVWHADDTSHMLLTKHRQDYCASSSLLHSLSSFIRLWGSLDTQNERSWLVGSFYEQLGQMHYKHRKLQSPQGIRDEGKSWQFSSCWQTTSETKRGKRRTQGV